MRFVCVFRCLITVCCFWSWTVDWTSPWRSISADSCTDTLFTVRHAHTCTQTHTYAHRHKRMLGVGIAGYLTIRYNHYTWLTVTIISRCSDSAITDIFLENPIILHHDIGLNKMPVKRLGASFLSLFKSKLLENSKKKICNSIVTCWVG